MSNLLNELPDPADESKPAPVDTPPETDGGDCDHDACIAFRAAARTMAEAKIDQYQAEQSLAEFAQMLGVPTARSVLNLSRPSVHEGLPDNYVIFELAPADDAAWLADDKPVARIDVQINGYLLTRAELIELHAKLGAELGL